MLRIAHYDAEYVRGNTVFLADKGGEILGSYVLERISNPEVKFSALFVEPEHTVCGFGHALIAYAKETARRARSYSNSHSGRSQSSGILSGCR